MRVAISFAIPDGLHTEFYQSLGFVCKAFGYQRSLNKTAYGRIRKSALLPSSRSSAFS